MSEGMFLGRKFTIPYEISADQHAASIARAQLATGTASPGSVIQVGDTVMAYGVTPAQAKMGDIDVRLRSFEQLSNQAQDVVRRNLQWQYGAQVTVADEPMAKGFISRLLGIAHWQNPSKQHFPDPPLQKETLLAPPDLFPVRRPNMAAQTPAPTPAPTGTQSTPAPASKPSRPTQVSQPPVQPPAQPPVQPRGQAQGRAQARGKRPVTAAASPTPPTQPNVPSTPAAAGNPAGGVTGAQQIELYNAFASLFRRYKSGRGDQWAYQRGVDPSNPLRFVLTGTNQMTGDVETQALVFDPATGGVTHAFEKPGHPTETMSVASLDELFPHIKNHKNSWGF